jgi:hypothetical protein
MKKTSQGKFSPLPIVLAMAVVAIFTGCPEDASAPSYTVTFSRWGRGNPSTVTANADTLFISGTSVTVQEGKTVGDKMPVSICPGYVIEGWTTGQYGSGSVFGPDTPINSNLTVYAQWLEVQSIEIKYLPKKRTYAIGEAFNFEELTVNAITPLKDITLKRTTTADSSDASAPAAGYYGLYLGGSIIKGSDTTADLESSSIPVPITVKYQGKERTLEAEFAITIVDEPVEEFYSLTDMRNYLATAQGGLLPGSPIRVKLTGYHFDVLRTGKLGSSSLDALGAVFEALPANKYVAVDLSECDGNSIGDSEYRAVNNSLVSLVLPAGLGDGGGAIGDYAFANCAALRMITFKGETVPVFGKNVFQDCTKLAFIYVPAAAAARYETAISPAAYSDLVTAQP